MNGKKILNRLILVFLGLNIILFIINSIRSSSMYQLSDSRITQIKDILSDRGITIEAELPKSFAPKVLAVLNLDTDKLTNRTETVKTFFGDDLSKVLRSTKASEKTPNTMVRCFIKDSEILSFDGDELTYQNTNIDHTGDRPALEKARLQSEAFIERLGKKGDFHNAYLEVCEEEKSWRLKYFPIFDGIPVFDSYIEVFVFETGIGNANIFLGQIEAVEETKQEIYPIDRVLFSIGEEIVQAESSVIQDVTLGYKSLQTTSSSLYGKQIVPAYKIRLKGLDYPIFVNAYTNEIIK